VAQELLGLLYGHDAQLEVGDRTQVPYLAIARGYNDDTTVTTREQWEELGRRVIDIVVHN
jgi:hypothetical protein